MLAICRIEEFGIAIRLIARLRATTLSIFQKRMLAT